MCSPEITDAGPSNAYGSVWGDRGNPRPYRDLMKA